MITFHEEGCEWEVEVCAGPYPHPKYKGETFDLKVLAIIKQNKIFPEPKVGEAFSVWRAEKGPYAGWSLRCNFVSL